MKKRIFKYLITLFVFTFMYIIGVKAQLPDYFDGVKQVGDLVMDKCTSTKKDENGNDVPNCYAMPLKTAIIDGYDVAVICTKYYSNVPAGRSCNRTNWPDSLRYGVGAIINEAKSKINEKNISVEYFAAEMAINRLVFDNTSGANGAEINSYGLSNNMGLYAYSKSNNSFSTDPVVSTTTGLSSLFNYYYENIGKPAVANYDTVSKTPVSLSTKTLTFTEKGNNYESNSITIKGDVFYTISIDENLSPNDVFIVEDSFTNSFKVVVDKKYVTEDLLIKIKIDIESTEKIEVATNYDCGAGFQSLTPVKLEHIPKLGSEIVSGTIALPKKGSLEIHKLDNNHRNLAGAKIKITGPNGYSHEFTTTTTFLKLVNLEFGTYVVEEIETPPGYVTSPKVTTVLSQDKPDRQANFINKKTKVKISKVDASGKKELPGATLEIQDKGGKIVKYCTDDKGNTNIECKWVSTDKPYEIEGLPVGKYYLVETIAPKGYVLNKEKIEFEIKDDSSIVEVDMKNDLEVEVPDTLSSRSALLLTIAMFDVALGIGILTFVKKNKEGNN